jgi:signal transduction histidine kinase
MSESLPLRELIHEMRNELAVARANLEGLVDGKLAPTRDRLLGIIQALAQLDALVDDVNAQQPAVAEVQQSMHFNVCDLLDREFRSMDAVARMRDVTVEIERCQVPADECLHFFGNPARIGQIVKNVLLNAIRYAPRGGSVSVDCSRHADQMQVRIADTGPGIPEAERERVFEPGFRGAASAGTPGTGYGLAVVKRLVEQQGGSITASSVTPHGAVFTVRLPGTGPDDDLCANCRVALSTRRPDTTNPQP